MKTINFTTDSVIKTIINAIVNEVFSFTNYREYEDSEMDIITDSTLADGTKISYEVKVSAIDNASIINGFKIDMFAVIASNEVSFIVSDYIDAEVMIEGARQDAPYHWTYDSYYLK